ncbi:MAG: NAD(P)/FAD-dependent oxidoreductase [Cyanobacteria bacterium SZAS LIN-5]|nr:NAD(P)/FAD-dependent oxidoreductase [Cyanobacteria bacterium SZAS LIN-5]
MEAFMKKVVIIGGGFAGMRAAKTLSSAPVSVTVVDRKNHHTFQPLLYQVATATLSPADIAQPIRAILQKQANTTVLMDEVLSIDPEKRLVHLKNEDVLPFDYLILATGATHSYFGHHEWERYAPGLKTIEDALRIRGRTFSAFEEAERDMVRTNTHKPLNFVVIGGGPTGVEVAGALADTCHVYLRDEFRHIDTTKARVILLEAMPKVLGPYPEDLSASAIKQLKDCGVEVMTNTQVTDVQDSYVMTSGGRIDAAVIIWAAGVQASPLGKSLGFPVDKRGCVIVDEFLNPPHHPEIFICGDLAHLELNGKLLPGVAQTAMQMGVYAAEQIVRDLANQPRKPFRYFDKGDMATIGRMRAVANIKWPFNAHARGVLAWLSWLIIHIFFLIGLRNRFLVFCQWLWTFTTCQRGAQLITETEIVCDHDQLAE